jgi:hypothetical protein
MAWATAMVKVPKPQRRAAAARTLGEPGAS